MKLAIVFSIMYLFIGCYVPLEYDGETKLINTGQIFDENNNPISNIEVIVANQINRNGSFGIFPFASGYDDYQEIGIAKTNGNGEFLILNPSPINEDQTLLIINSDGENGLQRVNYYNILKSDYKNFKLNIGSLKIFQTSKLVNVNIFYNKTNFQNIITNIKFIGNIAAKDIAYNTSFDFTTDQILQVNRNIQVLKNQTVILEFTVLNANTNVSEVLQKEIVIGNQNRDFTLNY